MEPDQNENSAWRAYSGLGLSTANERETLPRHLRLAEAVMLKLPMLKADPPIGVLPCSVVA